MAFSGRVLYTSHFTKDGGNLAIGASKINGVQQYTIVVLYDEGKRCQTYEPLTIFPTVDEARDYIEETYP